MTAVGSVACSQTPDGSNTSGTGTTGMPSPNYCDPTAIMVDKCAGIACHGSPGNPGKYYTDMFNPPPGQTVGQTLLNTPATYEYVSNYEAECPTTNPELLINSSAPNESLMLKKIFGTQACGVKMPNSTTKVLSQQELDCFVDYVYGVIAESSGMVGTITTNVSNTATSTTGVGTTTTGTGTTGSSTGTGGATSTTGTATTGGGPPPTFETVKVVLTQNVTNCSGSDCHGGVEYRVDFRDDPMIAESLYQRLTTWYSDLCGMNVVTPGQPENSALLKVLTEGCGTVYDMCEIGTECIPRMPLNCEDGYDCIPPDYVEAVRQWIANGAPEN